MGAREDEKPDGLPWIRWPTWGAPESNAFIDALQATIVDLRVRLDASEAERRRLSERLTGLLTSRQAGSVPAVSPARPGWWRRWFR